jgi:hypothetical protein
MNQSGFKAENEYNSERVSVNTHKTMNFTVYNNNNNSRYNISYTVKSHRMLKTRIQVGGTTPRYNPTILINVSTLSKITLNGINRNTTIRVWVGMKNFCPIVFLHRI